MKLISFKGDTGIFYINPDGIQYIVRRFNNKTSIHFKTGHTLDTDSSVEEVISKLEQNRDLLQGLKDKGN